VCVSIRRWLWWLRRCLARCGAGAHQADGEEEAACGLRGQTHTAHNILVPGQPQRIPAATNGPSQIYTHTLPSRKHTLSLTCTQSLSHQCKIHSHIHTSKIAYSLTHRNTSSLFSGRWLNRSFTHTKSQHTHIILFHTH
jgi:hypothetical protein